MHVPPDPRAAEFWLRNRRPDRWKDAKQLETRGVEDDPLLAFLKSINGRVMRPVEQDEPVIEAEYAELKPMQGGPGGRERLLVQAKPR